MDFHKLQQQLYDWDPTDPQEELRQLREAAGKSHEAAPSRDYLTEHENVREGSLPLDMDSVSDFAALAGIRIDEKQKKGPEGQAKGDVPWPKTSKPSGDGEQPHPLKDKLVGEGPGMDAFKAGYKDYNNVSGLTKASQTGSKKAKTVQKTSSQLPSELAKYEKALDAISKNPKLKAQFDKLMQIADPSLSKKKQPVKTRPVKPQPTESKVEESVRDMLWRKLNSKK